MNLADIAQGLLGLPQRVPGLLGMAPDAEGSVGLLGLLAQKGATVQRSLADLASNPRDYLAMVLGDAADKARASTQNAQGLFSVMPQVRDQSTAQATQDALNLLGAIKAYHGSPHTFSKFDLSKMGSGEGAQAYGWGGYFAENPGVAEDYARKLASGIPTEMVVDGKAMSFEKAASRAFGNESADALVKSGAQNKSSSWALLADVLRSKGAKAEPKFGNQYDVSLRWPDAAREATDPLGPQHFLDWDSVMSSQPQEVKDAVMSAFQSVGRRPNVPDMDGGSAYRNLWQTNRGNGTPVIGQEAASQLLKDRGIPGIRYLDGGSRGAGTGTSNYVVFDDALINILKRNGLVP